MKIGSRLLYNTVGRGGINCVLTIAPRLNDFALELSSDLSKARARHEARVLDCGRSFLAIVTEARTKYDPSRHEAAQVLASSISDVIGDFRSGIDPTQEDLDRFFSGLRHLFRTHPEDLARFAVIARGMKEDVAEAALNYVVKSSLSKMPSQLKERFLAAERGSSSAPAQSAEALEDGPQRRRSLAAIAEREIEIAKRSFR